MQDHLAPDIPNSEMMQTKRTMTWIWMTLTMQVQIQRRELIAFEGSIETPESIMRTSLGMPALSSSSEYPFVVVDCVHLFHRFPHRLRFTELPETYLDEARIIDVDAEDDPGDGGDSYAGMKLPKVIVRSIEERNIYFRQFIRTMCRCGDETYRLLEKVIVHKQQLSPTERHNLQTWSTYFHSYLVEHYYDILGSVEETPTGPGGAKEQTTGAMCLSVEIWRMKLLLNYHRLVSLKNWKIRDSPFLIEWLIETPGVRLDHPPKEPMLKTQKDGSTTQKQRDEHKEAVTKFRQAMAIFEATKKIDTIPILQLKQTQVMRLVQHITSRLRVLPYHDDVKKLFELCELRVAMFFCQTMPDTILNHEKMRVSLQKEIDTIKALIEEEANTRDQNIQGEFQVIILCNLIDYS
jgi:hypothetical protein